MRPRTAVLVRRISSPNRSALIYELSRLDISRALDTSCVTTLTLWPRLIALFKLEKNMTRSTEHEL